MKPIITFVTALVVQFSSAAADASESGTVADAPNGIPFPADYRDWRVISISHRTDNHTMRAILGNDRAIDAARNEKTNPWPDGSILGKVVHTMI